MPLTLTLPVLVALTAFVIGLAVLVVGVLLGWRDSIRRSDALFQDMISGQRDPAADPAAFGALLAEHDDRRAAEHLRLRESLDAMRADLEWLTGERMIEQAIQMCRDGYSTRDVSAETGLAQDTVRTLNLLRAH